MFNKGYEKVKEFIRENYKFLLTYIVLAIVLLWPLPYYIYTGGGTMAIDDHIKIYYS